MAPIAVQAMLNTSMATAFSVLVWLAMDQLWGEKVKSTGLCFGVVAGISAITPAAGMNPRCEPVPAETRWAMLGEGIQNFRQVTLEDP